MITSSHPTRLTCSLCGYDHQSVPLAPAERALCVRCGTVLAQGARFGRDSTLVYAVTGLILAIPALRLPFITAGKFGQEHGGLLLTGVEGLWENNKPFLAIWVLLCGTVVPIALLTILVGALLPARLGWEQKPGPFLSRAAVALGYWAIPEVQVLAVLVALMKLGALVHVRIGTGFWCYIGMSICLLLAWRSFLYTADPFGSSGEADAGAASAHGMGVNA